MRLFKRRPAAVTRCVRCGLALPNDWAGVDWSTVPRCPSGIGHFQMSESLYRSLTDDGRMSIATGGKGVYDRSSDRLQVGGELVRVTSGEPEAGSVRISISQLRELANAPDAICPTCGGPAGINPPGFETIAPTQEQLLALVEAIEAADEVVEWEHFDAEYADDELIQTHRMDFARLRNALARFDLDGEA